ncbi:MAG: glycoside hydrolase family 66 protein [Bacteroidales bacterium]|nr:glycoside hydrolase family 66 protein [Bacteroidales bacterium]
MKIKHLIAAALCILLAGCTKPQQQEEKPAGPGAADSEVLDKLPASTVLRSVTVHTDKAAYAPGETVTFTCGRSQSMAVRYWHLGTLLSESLLEDPTSWTWTPPTVDFQGYYVELVGKNAEGEIKTVGSVAVDVSSDWTRFPRYGFLSRFGDIAPSQIASVIDNLKNYHINGIQYYDWMYDHHHPLAGTPENPDSDWPSIIGDMCQKSTVEGYIAEAHRVGIASMFYDLCYGALEWAEKDGVDPTWYLFKDNAHKMKDYHPLSAPFRSNIYLVDPGNAGWLAYFADRVDEVYEVFDFDGFHIDQLGGRGNRYNYAGSQVNVPEGYGKFLQAMKAAQPDKKLAFNAVSRYGQANIAAAPSDFLYNEVWDTKFSDINRVVQENRRLAPQKNMVLAAYMNYKQKGKFNTASVLLMDAVLFAMGGSHLELGEHMLCNEYFPDNSMKMDAALESALPAYYDFLTGYENVLRDGVEAYDLNVSASGVEVNPYGPVKGSVNYYAAQKDGKLMIHLLNFTDATHLDWRDDARSQKEPAQIGSFTISIRSGRTVSRVWAASPDIDGGVPKMVDYKADGASISVTVPSLKYWTMIVVE